jgi:hypothetical protein
VLDLVVGSIEACIPVMPRRCGVTLILENHYKDDFWSYPEFAQKMDVFWRELVDRLRHPRFRRRTSTRASAFLAGDDPLELLRSG